MWYIAAESQSHRQPSVLTGGDGKMKTSRAAFARMHAEMCRLSMESRLHAIRRI